MASIVAAARQQLAELRDSGGTPWDGGGAADPVRPDLAPADQAGVRDDDLERLHRRLEKSVEVRERAAKVRECAVRETHRARLLRERASVQCERAARTQFRETVDRVIEGFVVFDAEGRLVARSDKHREFNALIEDVAGPGTSIDEILIALLKNGELLETATRVLADPQDRLARYRDSGMPFEVRLKTGAWVQIREHRGVDGSAALVATDVTEIKRHETALRKAYDHLEQRIEERTAELREAMRNAERANRIKSEFLARMSHDLRTPLNAIIGFSELIKDQICGPIGSSVYSEYAQDIHSSGTHLHELINDLLDLSKIEAGKFSLSEDVLVVPELIENAIHTIEPLAIKKPLRIDRDVAADLPKLRADHRAAKQMLLNLLSNAVKFTPDEGTVRVIAFTWNGGISIAVQDSGPGIDPRDFDKVFSPYYHSATPEVTGEIGTGLGLPVTKSLVELHDGSLDLKSTLGVGTTFTLSFPPTRAVASTG